MRRIHRPPVKTPHKGPVTRKMFPFNDVIMQRWGHRGMIINFSMFNVSYFDEILITGCTGSCQCDNFQCSQWWKFRQNNDIFVSVMIRLSYHRFLRHQPEQSLEQTVKFTAIWDAVCDGPMLGSQVGCHGHICCTRQQISSYVKCHICTNHAVFRLCF